MNLFFINSACFPSDLIKAILQDFLKWKDLRQLHSAIDVNESTFNEALTNKWNSLPWRMQELDDSSWFLTWLQWRRVEYPHLSIKFVSNNPLLCSHPDVRFQEQLRNVKTLEWFYLPLLNRSDTQKPSLALFTSLTSVSLHGTLAGIECIVLLISECASRLQILKVHNCLIQGSAVSHASSAACLSDLLHQCNVLEHLYLWNISLSIAEVEMINRLGVQYIIGGLDNNDRVLQGK